MQNVIELAGGASGIKLTTASYQRPSGANIHRFPRASSDDVWGVSPDANYDLALKATEANTLLEEMSQTLSTKQTDNSRQLDRQLQLAIKALTKEPARANSGD